MLDAIRDALRSHGRDVRIDDRPTAVLPSVYDVSGLAACSIGAAASEVALLLEAHGVAAGEVVVDRALASQWFASTIDPVDFELPPVWDALAGDYRCADGWIRLHTNAPHHRAAAVGVLGVPADRDLAAGAVARWSGADLEAAIVAANGCAAELRDADAWAAHEQGRSVAAEPLVHWSGGPAPWTPGRAERPLTGLRVLDLTRVLAGPVCTRFLAGWGADVLRVDPPDWQEPAIEPEVTLGKRCARLDLRTEAGRFRELAAAADVVVHGYRPGALDGLGLGRFEGAVDVALDAYGWTGPWARRRGFDSLVQMSSGIAAAGMATHGADRPVPLPVQALDHATGYLMAAAVIRALRGGPARARLSLARTAALLVAHPGRPDASFRPPREAAEEQTAWGRLRRLVAPVTVGGLAMRWDRPACPLGTHAPGW